MDVNEMTATQRQTRRHIRNFLLIANREELQTELEYLKSKNETFRAECVQELIDELE